MEILNNALAIVMVVLGLGFVIFIHELGHFLLAKWNGVKVEKFAIGFDFVKGTKLYSKRIGETEYVIGAIPLGGYVKMLGEDAMGGQEEGLEKISDPRAYHNRPVGARMAIITAGVIMNLLFGLACFAFVYLRGKVEVPPIIGSVVAGQPAYAAGLRPGDRIVAIDGHPIATYSELQHATIFSASDQVLRLTIERPGEDAPIEIPISPKRREGGLAPTIGITSAMSLELLTTLPFNRPAGLTAPVPDLSATLKGGGEVIAAGTPGATPAELENSRDLANLESRYRTVPLEFTILGGPPNQRGADRITKSIVLPPNRFLGLGLRMKCGPVVAVQGGSPAEKAGIKPGDRIAAVDGDAEFDPMRLPDLAYERAGEDRPIILDLVDGTRAGPESGGQPRNVEIHPDRTPIWSEGDYLPEEPLEVPGLGLAVEIEPVVAGVADGSPAAGAGVLVGSRLVSATVNPQPRPGSRQTSKSTTLEFQGADAVSWPAVHMLLQEFDPSDVELSLIPPGQSADRAPDRVKLKSQPIDGWYNPRRGLEFSGLKTKLPPEPLPGALRRGAGEAAENAAQIFYLIRGLFERRISKDAMGGPIPIADIAFNAAKLGLDAFIPFLGMLSINLAVINFFPIPPLDGGQFLLLLGEALRGRPLPERYVGPITVAGLVLILALILFVNLNDVLRYLF